jgi:hypothetical protein
MCPEAEEVAGAPPRARFVLKMPSSWRSCRRGQGSIRRDWIIVGGAQTPHKPEHMFNGQTDGQARSCTVTSEQAEVRTCAMVLGVCQLGHQTHPIHLPGQSHAGVQING